jgi:hypothetical protein
VQRRVGFLTCIRSNIALANSDRVQLPFGGRMIESEVVSQAEHHNLSGYFRSSRWTDDFVVDDSEFVRAPASFNMSSTKFRPL